MLADPALTWTDAGVTAFEARSSAGDGQVMVRFEIDDQGDVIRGYSTSRPYDVAAGYAEAPWYYEFSDHREFGGLRRLKTACESDSHASGGSNDSEDMLPTDR